MNIAPCPHCGKPCSLAFGALAGAGFRITGWQAACDHCGYSGPACREQGAAVRAHDEISRNSGRIRHTDNERRMTRDAGLPETATPNKEYPHV